MLRSRLQDPFGEEGLIVPASFHNSAMIQSASSIRGSVDLPTDARKCGRAIGGTLRGYRAGG